LDSRLNTISLTFALRSSLYTSGQRTRLQLSSWEKYI
jgi:hypothetical protein